MMLIVVNVHMYVTLSVSGSTSIVYRHITEHI